MKIVKIVRGDSDPVAYTVIAEVPASGGCYQFGGSVDREHAKPISCGDVNEYFLNSGKLILTIHSAKSMVRQRYRSTVGRYEYKSSQYQPELKKSGLMMCDYDQKKFDELLKPVSSNP